MTRSHLGSIRPLVIAALLVAAACGSSDDGEPVTPPPTSVDGGGSSIDGGSTHDSGDAGSSPSANTFIVTGPGPAASNRSHVRVFDGAGSPVTELSEVFAGSHYGASVATCDVDGDGTSEIVVGEGPDPESGTRVRVSKANGELVVEWPSTFDDHHGGVSVACGDLDGDGVPEIVAGLGATQNNDTLVRTFDVETRAKKSEWLAYGAAVRFGVRVAVADVNGDGKAEVVTSPGPSASSGAHVKVFSGQGLLLSDVHAFDDDPIYSDFGAPFGAVVATGDLDGDHRAEIVVSPGPAPLATPRVRIYSADPTTYVLSLRSEFVSENPIPHLSYSGYFHVHDAAFGLHIPDVKSFTNWVYLWDTQYLPTARDNGLKVIYDLQKIIHERPKSEWDANLQAIAPILAPFKATIAALYLYDEADVSKLSIADQKYLIERAKARIPDIPVVISYFNQGDPPPDTLDWVGIDPYINYNVPNETGCVRRSAFDNFVMNRIAWARAAGKPIVLVPPSFSRTYPTPGYAMPTPCQQRWYLDAAIDEPLVKGVLWFMYGHVNKADRGEDIQGVGETPTILAWHKAMFPATRLGGYGAELAVGDVDGDGHAEVVVGHGKGAGNLTMVQVHAADGTKRASFSAYEGLTRGVSLAVGKRAVK